MKKLGICINSAFILNINSMNYYYKLVEAGLIQEDNNRNNFSKLVKKTKLKKYKDYKIKKIDKTNNNNNNNNNEKGDLFYFKKKYFKEDLICIYCEIYKICKFLNLEDSIKDLEEIKEFIFEHNYNINNYKIFQILYDTNTILDDLKKTKIRKITNSKIPILINNLKTIVIILKLKILINKIDKIIKR